jgi:hypothetical protein
MGKNRDKYRYVEIGLEWDSWVLGKFEEDAKRTHMTGSPAKLAAMRLIEYYQLVEKGIIVPGMPGMAPLVGQTQGAQGMMPMGPAVPGAFEDADLPPAGSQPSFHEPSESAVPTISAEPLSIEEDEAGDNADAALDYFLDDDDEDDE